MTRLKMMRIARSMKLRDVAQHVQITPQTVQQQEKKGIKKFSTARKYALAFGCDWRELVDEPPAVRKMQ